ncbi:hypothetical protein SUGI_0689710 [Cryptomeria japonica]|nr:hypothetical protein SUGI_0689710 [Cryptomeria japonica]
MAFPVSPSSTHYKTYASSPPYYMASPYPSISASPISPYVASAPAPSPPSPPQEYYLDEYSHLGGWDWNSLFTYAANWLTLACYGWFVLLMALDVWRAIRKRATWLPGKAFYLTGVTVQIIVWWTAVSHITKNDLNVRHTDNGCKNEDVDLEQLIVYHQIVLSGKVALCVFIGYLLPAMGAPSVRTFLALGISICVQIASEMIIVYDDNSYDSKTVHGLLRQKISAIFPATKKDASECSNVRTMSISWDDFEVEVLSSWLVARLCQADYVISSKVCGFLSEVIIGNFVYWFRILIWKENPVKLPVEYARILKLLCLPGEDPSNLWAANKMSFEKVKDLMRKACKKAKSSEEVKSFFPQYSMQCSEDVKKLLNMLQREAIPTVREHFPQVEKHYLKITVVSLITILFRLKAKSDSLKKVLIACRELWDLLSFADECDIDLHANEISILQDLTSDNNQFGMAAEMEFYKRQMDCDKLDPSCEESVTDVQEARGILDTLLKECEELLSRENLLGDKKENDENLRDSKDWMKIAPSYTLYKLCRLMLNNSNKDCVGNEIENCAGKDIEDCGDKDIQDFVVWTENALKNVIACCLSGLPDMLSGNPTQKSPSNGQSKACSPPNSPLISNRLVIVRATRYACKWGEEFKEVRAIHLPGKMQGNDGSMDNQN